AGDLEESFQHGPGDRSGINLVDLAAVVDVEGRSAFRRDLRQKFAEFFAESEMRPNDRQCFRIEIRHVYGITNRSLEKHRADRLRILVPDVSWRSRRRCAEMW